MYLLSDLTKGCYALLNAVIQPFPRLRVFKDSKKNFHLESNNQANSLPHAIVA